jgi:hypothetical protein
MKRLPRLFASLAAAIALTGAAHAQAVQGLDGRWEGKITLPNGADLTGVFRVETKNGVTTAVMDSVEQGARDIPATVTRTDDKVVFSVPTALLTYSATLSADGKTLTGDLAQGGGSVPYTMTQKPASTVAALTGPAIAGLDGAWEGPLSTIGGNIPLIFRLSTAGGKTTTLIDIPLQNINGMAALASRDGQTVTIDIRVISATFVGELSADSKSISGTWSQGDNSLPLVVTKQ